MVQLLRMDLRRYGCPIIFESEAVGMNFNSFWSMIASTQLIFGFVLPMVCNKSYKNRAMYYNIFLKLACDDRYFLGAIVIFWPDLINPLKPNDFSMSSLLCLSSLSLSLLSVFTA